MRIHVQPLVRWLPLKIIAGCKCFSKDTLNNRTPLAFRGELAASPTKSTARASQQLNLRFKERLPIADAMLSFGTLQRKDKF